MAPRGPKVAKIQKAEIKDILEPIDICFRKLYHLKEKFSKKTRGLKVLNKVFKYLYVIQNRVADPHCAAGTRWIAHKLFALESMLDKFGMCLSHFGNIISDSEDR